MAIRARFRDLRDASRASGHRFLQEPCIRWRCCVRVAGDSLDIHEADPAGILAVEDGSKIAHEALPAAEPVPGLPADGMHDEISHFERRIGGRLGMK